MAKKLLESALEFDANAQSNPDSNYLRFFNDLTGGRVRMHRRIAGHRNDFFQTHLGRGRAVLATAQGDTTSIDSIGAAFTSVGALGVVATDPTGGLVTGMRRVGVSALASSSAVAGLYAANAQWTRGDAAGKGGFYMAFRWAPGVGQASTTRAFCGVTSLTSTLTDAEPSDQTDVFGMGWDAEDTKINIMHRTGSGTVQKYAMFFDRPTAADEDCYQFEIYAPSNGSSMAWRFERLSDGAFDFDTYFTDIPAQSTFLAPRVAMSVGGVNSVIGIRFMNFYAESDV